LPKRVGNHAHYFEEVKDTGVDFNVVVDPNMNRLRLMTSDAG
jgi:hypothetical protein